MGASVLIRETWYYREKACIAWGHFSAIYVPASANYFPVISNNFPCSVAAHFVKNPQNTGPSEAMEGIFEAINRKQQGRTG